MIIKKVLPACMFMKKCINKECGKLEQCYKTFTSENQEDHVCNNGICYFKAKDQAKYNLLGYNNLK